MMMVRSAGIVWGGGALLPGRVTHVPPHALSLWAAKPLKDAVPGDVPPLTSLFIHHCAPQKLTVAPTLCGSTSPMTKPGPVGAVISPLTHRPKNRFGAA